MEVDNLGRVVTSTDPTGGAGAWEIAQVLAPSKLGTVDLAKVSCPTVGLCVALDHSGDVVTSRDPTGGAAAWTATRLPGVETGSEVDVSCPTASLCVVVDGGGQVFTSTDPTGRAGAWQRAQIPSPLVAVSCGSPTLCVATNARGQVLVSSDPTGGSGAWTLTDAVYATDLSCSGNSFCAAINQYSGNVTVSTDPLGGTAAWTASHIDNVSPIYATCGKYGCTDNGLTGISCITPSLCVAVDSGGTILTSLDPTGGATAWQPTAIGESFTAISCPSGLCMAASDSGAVVFDHGSGWVTTQAVDTVSQLDGISCPSRSLCDAIDSTGDAVITARPLRGTHWTIAPIDAHRALLSISCPTVSLCVTGDTDGDVVSSDHPARASGWRIEHIDAANRITEITM